jgi:hypothetical protein
MPRRTNVVDHAVVDAADLPLLTRYRWHLNNGYARHTERLPEGGWRHVYLHREIVGDLPDGMEVDHINGDKLDCRRENLRLVTRLQNSHNRRSLQHDATRAKSGFRWVYSAPGGKWMAQVRVNYRKHYLVEPFSTKKTQTAV